jgi:hypothetical protein
MMTNSTADSHTQTLRLTEGRVWTRPQITRRFIVLRFAIKSSASYDQAPDTNNIEPVLDCIIDTCQCPFPVDRIAIINFDQPVPTHRGNTYFTYAFLSPRSTNPLQTSSLPTTNIRRQLEILQGKLHLRLDGPHFFHDTPHLPPIASHLRVTIPSINDMGESLHFLLDGISVSLLLGDSGHENILTLRYLAFQIFNAVKSLHSTLSPYHPFPSPHGYSWFDGLLRNPWSGVQTPQVLGYSPMRVALILGRGFKPLRGVGVPHVQSGYTLA